MQCDKECSAKQIKKWPHLRTTTHIQLQDKSWHALLSPRDARTVVQSGWGELWPASCLGLPGVPVGYVLVFAPRGELELEVLRAILTAAHKYSKDADG